MDRPQWLTEISTAIADGEPVDWAAVDDRQMSDQDRELVRRFRLLEQIAQTRASASLSLSSHSGDSGDLDDLSAEDSAEPLTTWGALTHLEKIGNGAFGDVYRAHDPQLDRTVALKLMRRRERNGAAIESQVIEEGRLLARVHHPNVVTVYGAERIDGRVGLWMEFIEGRTLEDEVNEDGPLKPEDVLKIGLDLCSALQAVHRAGVLHLDLKAQNVMRVPTGRVVLTDFGVARDTLHRAPDERFELAGTPLYIAPELLEGHPPSVRSEVYSLGVLLFHLASGSFPLHARTLRDLRAAHVREARVRLTDARPDLPSSIAAVIERATHPNPSRRYQTTIQLERALKRPLSLRVFANRKWWIALAACLGAVVAFAGSFLAPKMYRSEATLLIVPQQVTAGSSLGAQPRTRLQSLVALLLSRTRLERIITDLNLYEDARRGGALMEDIVAGMKRDLVVSPVVSDQDTFRVAFVYPDARMAMKVTDRLASVLIEEGLSDRARLLNGADEFLDRQIAEIKTKLTNCDLQFGRGAAPTRIQRLECDAMADGLKALLIQQMDAQIRSNLERRQTGGQITLLDRARLPERPISPDRVRISGIGLLVGLAIGLLLAIPSSLRVFRRPNTATA